jgi:hypothetical protein
MATSSEVFAKPLAEWWERWPFSPDSTARPAGSMTPWRFSLRFAIGISPGFEEGIDVSGRPAAHVGTKLNGLRKIPFLVHRQSVGTVTFSICATCLRRKKSDSGILALHNGANLTRLVCRWRDGCKNLYTPSQDVYPLPRK